MRETRKILIVDDNPVNLEILAETLEDDHELTRAQSGEQCLEVAAREHPDLVLLDVMMPGIDGYEACRRLRAMSELRHTKIIMVSAKAMLSERLAGYEAGADDYLVKPFDEDELLSKVRVFLRLKTVEQSHDELEETNRRLEAEVRRLRRLEERLEHDALHDVLTSLPNRALLTDRIDSCLYRARRDPDVSFAVLFLDLDHFKHVNDVFGHRAGDRFLVEVGQRLQACVRAIDFATRISDGSLSRVGGDEFAVLLDGLAEPDDALLVAERIRDVLSQPMHFGGRELRPTASMGIAVGPADYQEADEILRDADTALYQAKEQGRNRIAVFDADMRSRVIARLQLESELRKALGRGQLHLQYQPIVSVGTEEIHGFEALVRWTHPEHGSIPPARFIPIAEESDLIITLGSWILRTACTRMAEWRRRFPEHPELSISVNLSGRQFASPHLAAEVEAVLEETGLDPEHLNLELTESILMGESRVESENLAALRGRGVGLHMDDFGTGYSSLSYLSRLPITALKLDRSFVQAMATDPAGESTVEAILKMSHSRGLKVIAEGVETARQAKRLEALGCSLAQGFLYSRPLDPEMVELMLTYESRPLAA